MISSELKTYKFDNGELLRAQCVRLDAWASLHFFKPDYSEKSFEQLCNVYRNFLVPFLPIAFPKMLLFRLPEGYDVKLEKLSKRYGEISNPLTMLAIAFSENLSIKKGRASFKSSELQAIYEDLVSRGAACIICGKRPDTKVIPVGNLCGFLSESATKAPFKVNSSFFVMDPFDCGTLYDTVGTPFGLQVENGKVLSPPLFNREALLVDKEGKISIKQLDIYDVELEINGKSYKHLRNCTIYERPRHNKLPLDPFGKFTDVVIIGTKAVAIKRGTGVSTKVPSSGFVMRVPGGEGIKAGDIVCYKGFEGISFGIQVGNSIIVDGKKTEDFVSKFYNIRKLGSTEYPPSLYPLDYKAARAARIALGANRHGNPCIIWAEGAGKVKYIAGTDSRGASLLDMCNICEDFGLMNAVSLDGGGSAQILFEGNRALHISDRTPSDNSDAERAVPAGIYYDDCGL